MTILKRIVQRTLFAVLLSIPLLPSLANADWLAADPGTSISFQLNRNGLVLVRPVNGTWSHPVCTDVSAAVLVEDHFGPFLDSDVFERLFDLLKLAAVNGSVVNVFANPDACHTQGFPLIQAARLVP